MKKKHPEMVKITVKPQKKTVIGFSGDKWISFLIYVGTISLGQRGFYFLLYLKSIQWLF